MIKATTSADSIDSMILIAIGWNSLASTPSKLNSGMKTTKIIEIEVKRQLDAVKKGKAEGHVRKVNEDGSSVYLRPMPGASRMYVETDIPEINTKDLIKEVRLPKLISVSVKELIILLLMLLLKHHVQVNREKDFRLRHRK